MEKLIELTKTILSKNPGCLLSGSLALSLQKIIIRRQPTDIDIFLPFNQSFCLIDGMKEIKDESKEHYESGYDVVSYKIDGVKVDVFTPQEEGYEVSDLLRVWRNEINMIEFTEIIRFKVEHSFGDHYSRFKHKDDLIHLLVSNVE